jgi:1-acyl-sn-glycerol-3-phosphate acyltransferase
LLWYILLAISLPRNLTFMGKEELVHRPIIGKLVFGCGMIPLSRDGGDAAKLRQAVRALKEGKVLAIFPQGKRCRRPLNPEDFKAGVGMMAALSGAKILPVGIVSKHYKVRLFRKTYVRYGEPISVEVPEEMGKKEQSLYIADRVYQEIAALEKEAAETYQNR